MAYTELIKPGFTGKAPLFAANDLVPVYSSGDTVEGRAGKDMYRYVKITIGGTTANTLEPGRPVYYDSFVLGTTKTDKGGTDKAFAGIMLNRVTSGNWAWIQIKGLAWAVMTSALTIDSLLIADTTNGGLKVAAAATDVGLGNNILAGTAPLPGDAGGAIFGLTFDSNRGIASITTSAGTLYDVNTSYTATIIDPTGKGSGAVITMVSNNDETWASAGAGQVLTITTPGKNYDPSSFLLIGVTPCLIRAPGC